jgi:hypothetical protein
MKSSLVQLQRAEMTMAMLENNGAEIKINS